MNFSANSLVLGFLLAVLIYFFLGAVADTFIKKPDANDLFHKVLLIICILVVLIFGFGFHL